MDWRYLEYVHLNRFPKSPVPCPREICDGQEFENVSAWFSHAATVQKYDPHVNLQRPDGSCTCQMRKRLPFWETACHGVEIGRFSYIIH